MEKGLISIIVPIYNAGRYLRQCLDSLGAQTYKNIEIICVDDGSTDSSAKILREYADKDKRIVLRTQKNSGPSIARRAALELAHGEYLMFLDADDWYDPAACEKMVAAMQREGADLVMCDSAFAFEDKNTVRKKENLDWLGLNIKGKMDLDPEIGVPQINTMLWNKLFKADLVRKFEITFPNIRIATFEDDVFIMKYMMAAKSYFGLEMKLVNHRIHKGSLQTRFLRSKNDKLLAAAMKQISSIFAFRHENKVAEKHDQHIVDKYFYTLRYNLLGLVPYNGRIKVVLDAARDVCLGHGISRIPGRFQTFFANIENGRYSAAIRYLLNHNPEREVRRLGLFVSCSLEHNTVRYFLCGIPVGLMSYEHDAVCFELFGFVCFRSGGINPAR
ncbi:MAG: glycosyltransferase [Alphaproteobacteria bacterium]|nr:glycosyltransferase [Alphaproteobacteria bacterium]